MDAVQHAKLKYGTEADAKRDFTDRRETIYRTVEPLSGELQQF